MFFKCVFNLVILCLLVKKLKMLCGEYERLSKLIINSTSHYESKMIHTINVPANCKTTLHIEIGQPMVTNSAVEAPYIPAYKTDGTVQELHNMLDECEKTDYADERCEIAEKIFTTILKKPEILLYEPKFRKVVIDKMEEIEETIKQRVKDVNNADYGRFRNINLGGLGRIIQMHDETNDNNIL